MTYSDESALCKDLFKHLSMSLIERDTPVGMVLALRVSGCTCRVRPGGTLGAAIVASLLVAVPITVRVLTSPAALC